MNKVYHLIGEDGKPYDSYEKGTLGGYKPKKDLRSPRLPLRPSRHR